MANLPKDGCAHPVSPENEQNDVAVRLFAALDSEISNARSAVPKHIRLASQDDFRDESQR